MNDKTILFYVMIGLLLFGTLVGIGYQVRQEIYRTNFTDQTHSDPVLPVEKSASYISVNSPENSQTTKKKRTIRLQSKANYQSNKNSYIWTLLRSLTL